MYEQMKNTCMVLGEHWAQDLPLEELTWPEKELSVISFIINEVKSEFLKLWWILKYESNVDKLWI